MPCRGPEEALDPGPAEWVFDLEADLTAEEEEVVVVAVPTAAPDRLLMLLEEDVRLDGRAEGRCSWLFEATVARPPEVAADPGRGIRSSMVGIPLDETGPGMPEVDGGPLGSRPPRPLAAAAEAARLSWSPFRGTSAPSGARDDTGSSGRASDPWRRGYSTAVHGPTGTSRDGATVTGLSLALNSFNFPSMQAAGRFSRLSTTTTTVSFSTELPLP